MAIRADVTATADHWIDLSNGNTLGYGTSFVYNHRNKITVKLQNAEVLKKLEGAKSAKLKRGTANFTFGKFGWCKVFEGTKAELAKKIREFPEGLTIFLQYFVGEGELEENRRMTAYHFKQ